MVKLPGAVVFGTRAIQVLQADSQRHSLDPADEDCRRCSILIYPLQTYSSHNILLIYFDLVSDYFRTHNMGASESFISPCQVSSPTLIWTAFNTIIANKHSLPLKHIWSIVKNPRGIRRWAVCKNPEEKRRCGFTVRARVSLGMKDGGLEESALAPAAICINTAQLPRAGSSLPSPGGADGYSTAYPGYTER